jgi:hypothetical protein
MKMRRNAGFVLSLEAVSALFLLLIAASSLSLYRFPEPSANDFFACSDAAVVLAKAHAFSGASLQEKVDRAAGLSGLCVEASSPSSSASSCESGKEAKERYSFSIPVWQGEGVEAAQISCWRAVM